MEDHNRSVGTPERRVLVSARRLCDHDHDHDLDHDLDLADEELPVLSPLQGTTRSLTAPELLGEGQEAGREEGVVPFRGASRAGSGGPRWWWPPRPP